MGWLFTEEEKKFMLNELIIEKINYIKVKLYRKLKKRINTHTPPYVKILGFEP